MVHNMTPLNEQFNIAVQKGAAAIRDFTSVVGDPTTLATARMYQEMSSQSRILAYIDTFSYCALVTCILIPFCFLLSPVKSEGSAGAH